MARDSFLYQAFIGINEELEGLTWPSRLLAITRHLARFLVELLSLLTAIPYGIKTALLARSLPCIPQAASTSTVSVTPNTNTSTSHPTPSTSPPDSSSSSSSSSSNRYGVFVARGLRYGSPDRQVLDAYVPARPAKQQQEQGQFADGAKGRLAPVVLFTHGGVWASGDTWHYAWLATRLAQMGFVVLVHTYTLYPEALIPQMVEETSEAMSWAMDNVESLFSGDPARISCVGHSAGAHLVALALLHRADAAARHQAVHPGQPQSQPQQQQHQPGPVHVQCSTHSPAHADSQPDSPKPYSQHTDGGSGLSAQPQPSESAEPMHAGSIKNSTSRPAHPRIQINDPRMPARFVGVCGAYDIGQHYEYEKWRGVHLLSMMARAFGGIRFFGALSPSVLLEACAQLRTPLQGTPEPSQASGAEGRVQDPQHLQLQGQEQHQQHDQHSQQPQQQSEGNNHPSQHTSKQTVESYGHTLLWQAGLHSPDLVAHLQKTAWCVMGSEADFMVPHTNGLRMAENLGRCGVPVTQLLHHGVAHSQFVTLWPLLEGEQLKMCCSLEPGSDERISLGLYGLPPYARDLVRQVLKGA